MRKISFKKNVVLICFLVNFFSLFSQRVHSLVSGITIDSILSAKPNAAKIARDAISGNLFYATGGGDIYEVYVPVTGAATDVLRYTASDHGIPTLGGLYFKDSVMYLCGNNWSAGTTGIGKVVKGILKPNGIRLWIDIVTTEPYPSANAGGDHGFTGVNLDPTGNFMYVSSGARTHLGEVRTNNGAWPGKREVPLTTRIFKFPVNTVGLTLPNDSALIDNSGYVFAWGTRNAYDMAWDVNDNLFAIDNSGERDDPEELNWLRQGRHYGYPWRMGGNFNPIQNSPYDVNLDPLVNHQSGGYVSGWFADVPGFPSVPTGVTFTEPVRNYGVAADFFRDSTTGKVKHASDQGSYITSFTSHRSPLGLVIDRDSALAAPFTADAFVLSFMPGGDSIGYTPLSPWGSPCPFVDPTRDLLQMKLSYNAGIDNYTMTTSRIVEGFYLPVDAELTNNIMYVIENGGDIWRLTFPLNVGVREIENSLDLSVFPNPAKDFLHFKFFRKKQYIVKISITDIHGKEVRVPFEKNADETITIDTSMLIEGMYFYTFQGGDFFTRGKFVKTN
jgi:hypothetical protein